MKKPLISWFTVAFVALFAATIFVRTYHYEEWLYFKMDQSRDALLVSNAINHGWQNLPLLGPRAGATSLKHGFLRLGPIFYYFQYLSGTLFHSTAPSVLAYPELFFSIAAIGLLYCFARLYFRRWIALGIAAFYALSFLVIEYSRFSWNPNSLPFFLILTFYGLLRFFHEPVEKRRKWWLALWALGLTVGSQLHFFGFFSLLGVSGLFMLLRFEPWKPARLKTYFEPAHLKTFLRSAGIVLIVVGLFYTPVVISESMRHWQNSRNFVEAMGSKPDPKPLFSKLSKDFEQNAQYYCLIVTAQCYDGYHPKKDFLPLAATGIVLLSGLALAVRGWRRETDPLRRDFLRILVLWVAVFTLLTVPVAYQIRPRFFIVVFAIPHLALGLIFEYLQERFRNRSAVWIGLIAAGVFLANASGTLAWFQEQAGSQTGTPDPKHTLILKAKDGVTLGELEQATDWMYARHTPGQTLYYYVKPEHVRPIQFLLQQKKDPRMPILTLKLDGNPNAQYFAVTPTGSGTQPITDKYGAGFQVLASQPCGQITVYEIAFPDRPITADTFRFNKSRSKTDRVFWGDVFGVKTDTVNIDNAE